MEKYQETKINEAKTDSFIRELGSERNGRVLIALKTEGVSDEAKQIILEEFDFFVQKVFISLKEYA